MSNHPLWMLLSQQVNLFDEKFSISNIALTNFNTTVFVGQYFETLASKIFKECCYLQPSPDCQPDFVIWNKKGMRSDILLEVKSTFKSHIFDIDQIKKYQKLQKNNFPYNNAKIYYVLFFYNKTRPLYMESSVHNLINNVLPESITCAVMLPIDLVQEIGETTKYSYGKWKYGDREFYSRMPYSIASILKLGTRESVINAFKLLLNKDVSEEYSIAKYDIPPVKVSHSMSKKFPMIVVSNKSFKNIINRV